MGVIARTPGAIHKSDRADRAAGRMRREPTRAERVLWKSLRLTAPHFRRQAPFGAFVGDFVCHSARLVVEVDGGVHEYEDVAARDEERSAWLRGRGYRVLRLTNKEVIDDVETAVMRILAHIGVDTPTPNPSPQGGGGL